nr:clavata3/endosperm 12 [Panax ginseng]
MILKISHISSPKVILLLSLLLLLLFLFFCRSHKFDHTHFSYNYHPLNYNRRSLSTKFDFTPFMHHHHHRKHAAPAEPEIDPRYDVDKRLVPTGPNPLHH